MRASCWTIAGACCGVLVGRPALADEDMPSGAPWQFEISARARYMGVPGGLMDSWFHSAKDEGWAATGTDRPKVQGAAYGAEFQFERNHSLGLFYVELAQSFMKEGYWDDREDGAASFIDGTWIRPTPLFGAVVVGMNGAYDAELVRLTQTDGKFGLSLEVGGGLGIATLIGHLDQWRPDPSTGEPAYQLAAAGMTPTVMNTRSRVWPTLDVNLGFKFNFANHAVLRLEAGIHDAFYVGGALGGRFGAASRPRSP